MQSETFLLRVLGPLRLADSANRPVQTVLAQSKRTALFIYLALARPLERKQRDSLLALFWPDSDLDAARNALNQALHFLRRSLGEEVVTNVGAQELSIDRAHLRCDALEFERLLDSGRHENAVALYEEPFLSGFHCSHAPQFDRWVENERSRLAARYLNALQQLAREVQASGDSQSAVEWWKRAAAADPLDVGSTIGLMRSFAEAGDRNHALRHAELHRQLIRQELELDPDPEVLRLETQLRNGSFSGPSGSHVFSPETVASTAVADLETPIPRRSIPTSTPAASEDSRGWTALPKGLPAIARPMLVATIAVVLLAAIAIEYRQHVKIPVDERRIVVARFLNRSSDHGLDPLGVMVADRITEGLSRSGLVAVTDPVTALVGSRKISGGKPDTLRPSDFVREIAGVTGAAIVVSGAYVKTGDSLVFDARVTSAKDNRLIASIKPVSVASPDVLRGVETATRRSLDIIARELDVRGGGLIDSLPPPPAYAAYREYIVGFEHYVDGDWQAAVPRFRRAYALDTTFAAPLFWAVLAYSNSGNDTSAAALVDTVAPLRSRLTPFNRYALDAQLALFRRDPASALVAARRAAALAPESEWARDAASMYMSQNRPRQALEMVKQLNPDRALADNWAPYWILTIRADHQLGDYRAEAEAVHTLERRFPTDNMVRQYLARVFAMEGRDGEIPALVDQMLASGEPRTAERVRAVLLDLERHGGRDAADYLFNKVLVWYRSLGSAPDELSHRWIAFMFADLGHDDDARREFTSLYEGVHDSAQTPTYAGMLGVLAARRGDVRRAATIADSISKLPIFWHGENEYWRARIAAELGHQREAVGLLRESFAGGYLQIDFDHTQRTNFPTLYGYPPFEALVQPDRPLEAAVRSGESTLSLYRKWKAGK